MREGDKRLLMLSDRLLEIPIYEGFPNKRIFEEFDFGIYYEFDHLTQERCGCAIGECMGLFDEWGLSNLELPAITNKFSGPTDSGISFFEITRKQYFQLFENDVLSSNASPEEVAYNIIDFVEGRHLKNFY